MKKVVIISVAAVTLILVILTLVLYKNNINSNIIDELTIIPLKSFELSESDYNAAYSDLPKYTGSVNSLADEIVKKSKLQKEYASHNMISTNIPNITVEQINIALNTLVDKSPYTNSYDPNESTLKMEFETVNIPKVSYSRFKSPKPYYSYNIVYTNMELINYNTGLIERNNDINLVADNTFMNDSMAGRYTATIYMRYSADDMYEYREKRKKYINETAEDSEEKEKMLEELSIGSPPRTVFKQGIGFKLDHIKFNYKLNLPATINIWNDKSSELFPCHLYSNDVVKEMKTFQEINSGYKREYVDYEISYYCEKLPNVNDYGAIKILFN